MPTRTLSKILTIVLIVLLAAPCAAANGSATPARNAERSFEERLLYGGTAVDVGDEIFFASDGGLFRRAYGSDESKLIVPSEASYLNWSRGRIWFVSGNRIVSCLPDGTDFAVFREFQGRVSHLYVSENEMFVLSDCTVYSLGEEDKAVFTRENIVGFIPEGDTFRWVEPAEGYGVPDCAGDEIYCELPPEFITHHVGGDDDFALAAPSAHTHTDPAAADPSALPEYTGPFVTVGDVTLPLAEHMPGSFFTKNGSACVCHHTGPTYCVESVGNCNCMRYYPTGYKDTCEVDLLGAQCFAFARMVFYKCFGFIDHSMNSSLYYNAGTVPRGGATANTVRELLYEKAAPGAHVRLSSGHSVSILTMDDDFIVIYQGNAGGDGVSTAPCVVSTRRYTWEQFASYAAAGISFVNMPYNYPGSSVSVAERIAGYYRLPSNLNLREQPAVTSGLLAEVPAGTILLVTETDGFWGRTEYDGQTGWIFLEYARFYSLTELAPSPNGNYELSDDGYIRSRLHRQTFDLFCESFDKQSVTVARADGSLLSGGEYVGTGCVVRLDLGGTVIDSAPLVVAGDVNGNGYVDVGDYVMVKRSIVGSWRFDEASRLAADVDGDGAVGADDYLKLRFHLLGIRVINPA